MKSHNLLKTTIAVAVANAIAVSSAYAQTRSEKEIEVIEVSATKRVTNIQDVPLAVTAISGSELVDMQITDIMSLEKAIPGVTITSFGNNPQVILRGAGSAGTTDIAVPIYHNGMYLPTTGQALAGYLDVERIEALRGPQGTLFGRNTYGGLINVITKNVNWFQFIKNPASYVDRKVKKLNLKIKNYKKNVISCTLLLSNDKEIKILNKKFRKKNKSTDVLSFPFYGNKILKKKLKKEKEIYLGDIIINLNKVNSRTNLKLFKLEFDKLWIHGFVHLFGHDHKKVKDFKKMNKIEKDYLLHLQ